jgi:hypothetical protein
MFKMWHILLLGLIICVNLEIKDDIMDKKFVPYLPQQNKEGIMTLCIVSYQNLSSINGEVATSTSYVVEYLYLLKKLFYRS